MTEWRAPFFFHGPRDTSERWGQNQNGAKHGLRTGSANTMRMCSETETTFPDFRVGKDLAVEVTALKTLGPDGTTSTDTLEKRVHQILEGMLEGKGIPFHTSYGRCHIVVEYNLQEAPPKEVLVPQARRALARYAEPGQPIYEKPFIDLECGVRLGLVQVQHQTQSERGLECHE